MSTVARDPRRGGHPALGRLPGRRQPGEQQPHRIDRRTNWAITLIASLLSVVFPSPDMPAYLLLVGAGILCVFLSYEVRRYRFFDLHRARVRFLEENIFANAVEPAGAEHARWREELGDALRNPTFRVTAREALSRRLRRIYALLVVILGVAWLAKATLFTTETLWTEAAEIPGVPSLVVVGLLGAFYVAVHVLSAWPTNRAAEGNRHDVEPGKWKQEGR